MLLNFQRTKGSFFFLCVACNCKKKFFGNYCKRNGYIISECARCPLRKNEHPSKTTQPALHAQLHLVLEKVASNTTCLNLTPEQISDWIQSSANTSMAFASHSWVFLVDFLNQLFLLYHLHLLLYGSLILGLPTIGLQCNMVSYTGHEPTVKICPSLVQSQLG